MEAMKAVDGFDYAKDSKFPLLWLVYLFYYFTCYIYFYNN